MSAGDIDDRLGSAARLQHLKETNAELARYLATCDDLPIVRACVPYGGGISTDGQTRYVDSRIDTNLDGIDVAIAIGRHESTEWALREFADIGEDYQNDPSGHRLANRAEMDKAVELLDPTNVGDPRAVWEMYDEFIDPQVRKIEHAEFEGEVPKDLALYPYEGTPLYDKLKEAQLAGPTTTD